MMRRNGIPTGVHVALLRDDSVLLMRRAGTGFFDGMYSLPGGHVEPCESIRHTAIREMHEELGVSIEVEALSYLGAVHRLSDTNRIDFFLTTTVWCGEPRICEPDKCDDLSWFSRRSLPDNVVPYIGEALHKESSPWFLELGWPSGLENG